MPRADATVVRVDALVRELSHVLEGAGISESGREASDIVAALQDAPRFWAAAHHEETLPAAYANGMPRAETEELVQAVLDAGHDEPGGLAIDLGTGSGAIALALATEGRFARIIATDASTGALEVARANAARLAAKGKRLNVEFRSGAWLAPVRAERARVIVSNPPYIAVDEAPALPASVRDWEPSVALFSSDSGMRDIAIIIRGAPAVLEPGGLLALEVDSRRASLAAELALADGRYRDVSVRLDLTGRERILLARRGRS